MHIRRHTAPLALRTRIRLTRWCTDITLPLYAVECRASAAGRVGADDAASLAAGGVEGGEVDGGDFGQAGDHVAVGEGGAEEVGAAALGVGVDYCGGRGEKGSRGSFGSSYGVGRHSPEGDRGRLVRVLLRMLTKAVYVLRLKKRNRRRYT